MSYMTYKQGVQHTQINCPRRPDFHTDLHCLNLAVGLLKAPQPQTDGNLISNKHCSKSIQSSQTATSSTTRPLNQNLHELQCKKATKTSVWHSEVMERRFGERSKPQEEVACRCSPIRENGRTPARCQHQSMWTPATERGSMASTWSATPPEPAAWKRFDTSEGMVGRNPVGSR